MNSFLQRKSEYSSPFLSQPFAHSDLIPCFSVLFKSFVETMHQPRYSKLYDQLKSFCVSMWIAIYNRFLSSAGSPLFETIREFCGEMESTLVAEFDRDATCELESNDVREGIEQVVLNMLGGGLLMLLAKENEEKEKVVNKSIQVLQFLKPEHLDVHADYVDNPLFERAVHQLQAVFTCRSPQFMLRCIAESAKTLFAILGSDHSSSLRDVSDVQVQMISSHCLFSVH